MEKNEVPRKESQVGAQAECLGRSISKMESITSTFDEKFSSILAQRETIEGKSEDQPGLVPLAKFLRDCTARINEQCNYLADLLDRIEL